MTQNTAIMKFLGVALAVFLPVLAAPAQAATDVPPVNTNAVAALETNSTGPIVREMSLMDCIQEALAHNLDVQIERYNPQLSLLGLRGDYSGYDPLFTASGVHSHSVTGAGVDQNQLPIPPARTDQDSFRSGFSGGTPWGMTYNLSGNVADKTGVTTTPFESSSGSISASATQPLLRNLWIDSTRLAIRLGKINVTSSEQKWRGTIIDTVTSVANAYYEVIFARENLKVKQEALELAQTQLNQDRQRSRIGTIAELDVQQDEAQAAQSKADLITAAATLTGDEDTLKNLISDDYKSWHNVDIQPTESLTATLQAISLQDSWDKGMSQRPDLLQARLTVQAAGVQLKYYRNQVFPELDLIGSYGYNGNGVEYNDVFGQFQARNRPFYSYGGQISIPLGNVGARNRYKAGKYSLKQTLLGLKQLEQSILVQIDSDVKAVNTKYQSVEATRLARIYAEAALDAEQKKYDVGKSTTFTVLQLQSKLTSARSDEIRAVADYNEALAKLAQDEGSTLERNAITIDTLPSPEGPGPKIADASGNTGFAP